MKDRKIKEENKFIPIFPICLGLGVGLGALVRNIGVGLAFGATVGTTLSLAIEYFLRREV
ncbi:MAG: hypothetical protein GTO18_17090 [Anaerolineales bacterium]|nr:hypothetical protein [Anaerolineales bacterium]